MFKYSLKSIVAVQVLRKVFCKYLYNMTKSVVHDEIWWQQQAKLDRAGDDLASSEREVRSLRRQLDSSQAELGETNRLKDNLTRDGRRWELCD